MGNTNFLSLTDGAHSVVVLANFCGCQCDRSLLQGDRREELLGKLRKAVEGAGFGVINGDVQPFGVTRGERNNNGATLNLILEDSGVSFDCYPEKMCVQMNLHYCNLSKNNDHKVADCIANIQAVLEPRDTELFDHIIMFIGNDD